MTRPWYAVNARSLLDVRKHGLLPEQPVAVVMAGPPGPAGSIVYVKPDMPEDRLDWQMLVNLDVWVCADETEALERVVGVTMAIARVKPRSLYLRFRDRNGHLHDVDVGSGTHHNGAPEHGIEPEHSFIFCPLNATGTRLGQELQFALKRAPHGDLE